MDTLLKKLGISSDNLRHEKYESIGRGQHEIAGHNFKIQCGVYVREGGGVVQGAEIWDGCED